MRSVSFAVAGLLAVAAITSAASSSGSTFTPGPFLDNIAGLTTNYTPPTPAIVVPSESVTISTWFGAYPCLGCGGPKQAQWCNGGIPQLANLTLHAETIGRDLDWLNIPTDYDGALVNDYESWHLGWDFSGEIYHNASILLARERHPHLAGNATLIAAIAREEFEAAAVAFFEATMRAMRSHRPLLGGIGFYGYPSSYTYWGNASAGAALNDKLHSLWNLTTAFVPSIYLPYLSGVDVPFARNKQYVDQQLAEVDRVRSTLAADVAAGIRVLPYTWYRYHPGEPHAYELYTTQDACLEFASLFTGGGVNGTTSRVDGAIIWGDETGNTTAEADVKRWLKQHAQYLGGAALPTSLDCGALAAAVERTVEWVSSAASHRSPPRRLPRRQAQQRDPLVALPLDGTAAVIPPFTRCSL